MKNIAVPVVMYHSVGITKNKKRLWSHISCPFEKFEQHLIWLRKKRFSTISIEELYKYMKNREKIPEKAVVLTFDDGYLDNWVFAYPLLKKFGFKATIYTSPEFVDPTKKLRPNLENVWNNECSVSKLKSDGYLSWNEMKQMEKEKIMDIQSHALTHTWYFKNSNIVDFRYPGDPYIWMTWNNHPDKKYLLQTDKKELINLGEPVYEFGKSLETKRYFPDKKLRKELIKYVTENGNETFFKKEFWKNVLFKFVEQYHEKNKINDRYESNEEYEKRIKKELIESKLIIEKKLNKKVNFLCWPGGGVNETALKIASDVGYLSSTYSSREKKNYKNMPGENPSRIKRMGVSLYWNGKKNNSYYIKYKNGFIFTLSLDSFRDQKISVMSIPISTGITRLYKLKTFILK
jgi:peptidoglycan/xylan/chitin deacetylase (PgdA/CDA1 family)